MEIFENEEMRKVTINEVTFYGFISSKKCQCGNSLIYNESYDALFCPACNMWAEEICDDTSCIYCKDRPVKPL